MNELDDGAGLRQIEAGMVHEEMEDALPEIVVFELGAQARRKNRSRQSSIASQPTYLGPT